MEILMEVSVFAPFCTELYDILNSYKGRRLKMYDSMGTEILDPSTAIFMYSQPDNSFYSLKKNIIGGVEQLIGTELSANFSKFVDEDSIKSFIERLRILCNRYGITFNTHKYNKVVTPKDFSNLVHPNVAEGVVNMNTDKSQRLVDGTDSTINIGPTTSIIVKEVKKCKDDDKKSDSKKCKDEKDNVKESKIYIVHEGKQYIFPTLFMNGAQALARHLSEGGSVKDSYSKRIIRECINYEKLRLLAKYIQENMKSIGPDALKIVKPILEEIKNVKQSLGLLSNIKTYESSVDSVMEQFKRKNTTSLTESHDRLSEAFGRKLNISESSMFMTAMPILVGVLTKNGPINEDDYGLSSGRGMGDKERIGLDVKSAYALVQKDDFGIRNHIAMLKDTPSKPSNIRRDRINGFRTLVDLVNHDKDMMPMSSNPKDPNSSDENYAFHAGWLAKMVGNDNLGLYLNDLYTKGIGNKTAGTHLNANERMFIFKLREFFLNGPFTKYQQISDRYEIIALKTPGIESRKASPTNLPNPEMGDQTQVGHMESKFVEMDMLTDWFNKFDPNTVLMVEDDSILSRLNKSEFNKVERNKLIDLQKRHSLSVKTEGLGSGVVRAWSLSEDPNNIIAYCVSGGNGTDYFVSNTITEDYYSDDELDGEEKLGLDYYDNQPTNDQKHLPHMGIGSQEADFDDSEFDGDEELTRELDSERDTDLYGNPYDEPAINDGEDGVHETTYDQRLDDPDLVLGGHNEEGFLSDVTSNYEPEDGQECEPCDDPGKEEDDLQRFLFLAGRRPGM